MSRQLDHVAFARAVAKGRISILTEVAMPPSTQATVAIILHFRDAESSVTCLRSVFDDGIERAVVVDNSEDDGKSLAKVRARLRERADPGFDVRLLESGKNLGFAAGVNHAMRFATNHYGVGPRLLINSDARLCPGAHDALRDAVARYPGLAIAAPVMEVAGRRIGFAYYHRILGLYLSAQRWGAFRYLSGCCLFVPTKLGSESLFDERFFFYGEDVELGWRSCRVGFALISVSEATVEHAVSGGSRNGSYFYEYQIAKGHLLLCARLATTELGRVGLIGARLITLGARALFRSARNRSMTPLRATVMAIVDFMRHRTRNLTPPP